jgi:hypothetical protein
MTDRTTQCGRRFSVIAAPVSKKRFLRRQSTCRLRVSEYLLNSLSIYLTVTLYALARHMMGDSDQHLTVLTGTDG